MINRLRILVTGGNGFIGSHLADELISQGFKVTLLDLSFDDNTKHLDCEKVSGDILNPDYLSSLPGYDVTVHLAAISRVEIGQEKPSECMKVNVQGTLNVVRAVSKNSGVLVYGSSREVYGQPSRNPVREDDPKAPISIYGVSKLGAEGLVECFSRSHGLRYVIVRFSNVYGSPRDLPERVTPRFMKLAFSGEPITVHWGKQALDFNFIDEVIKGLATAVKLAGENDSDVISNDFNLVSGKAVSILTLARAVKRVCNSKSEIAVEERRGDFDVTRFLGDPTKSRRHLGYKPRLALEEGLKIYGDRIQEIGRASLRG